MRTIDGFYTPAIGTAYSSQTVIRVRWPWLSFLGGSICLTLVFLLLVMLQTRRARVRVWKSSAIAPFFASHSASGEDFGVAGGLSDVWAMEKAAREVRVALVGDRDRWTFRRSG